MEPATIGAFEIQRELGRGGMGVVYLARDTRLERAVAIKALPRELEADPARLERFQREARLLAALNHPNIGAIYGVEEGASGRHLVLEYVEGETLASRLERGPLAVDEAVVLARQIAEALEAAHEKGIVHRDLKPGNVMVTPEGRVKVLDFGLARSGEDSGVSSSGSANALSPTVTTPMSPYSPTIPGAILGTAGYMSPEQARGKNVDKRSDIFSFGCVLYEMLTGGQPFRGETVSDSIGAVLHKEPDLALLPAETPEAVRRVLRRCLAKDRQDRLHDIADARIELQTAGAEAGAGEARGKPSRWVAAMAFAAGAAVMAGAAWMVFKPGPEPVKSVTRFSLTNIGMPADAFQGLALSPDGQVLAYRAVGADGRERMHVRALNALESQEIPGSESGWLPFFSPEGERVGFYSAGYLKMAALSGGGTKTIGLIDRGGYSGATWMPDDSIIFAGSTRQFGRIRASGGKVEALEVEGLPEGHFVVSPWALPGGEALLCGVSDGSDFRIAVYDLATRALTEIADRRRGFSPTYVASGHVLYQGAGNELVALPFDARQRRVTGEPSIVTQDLGRRVSYQTRVFAAASDGTLAYIRKTTNLENGALMWVDRKGEATGIVEVGKVVDLPRISPDGGRIAFRTPAPLCDIWVHDVGRGATSRVTRESDNHGVAWSADGQRLVFARLTAPSQWSVVQCAADGAGEVEEITQPAIPRGFVSSISPDGRYVLAGGMTEGGGDVYLADTQDKSVKLFLHSQFEERSCVFSPDGRYVAYVSEESGPGQVYVQPFPSLGQRVQVSTAGGEGPVWSRDGKELFFREDSKFMVAEVTLEPAFSVGRPSMLFETDASLRMSNSSLATYDVSPDGQRFVMVRERSGTGGAEVVVVRNGMAELGEGK